MTDPKRKGPNRKFLIAGVAAVAVAAWLLRAPAQARLLEFIVLTQDAPDVSALQAVLENAEDRARMLLDFWGTGKLPHRFFAVRSLGQLASRADEARQLALEASGDPDLSARELALGWLAERKHPRLAEAALAQLMDRDPEIRLLGLVHLRELPAIRAVPGAFPLLDDPEPRVAAMASAVLKRHTGFDPGVRLAGAVPGAGKDLPEAPALERLARGVAEWKDWRAANQGYFASAQPAAALPPSVSLGLADFALPDLAGNPRRLSELRGKIVLLNFWATWCVSCLAEFPTLSALQKRFPNDLAVVGISLDGGEDHHHDEGDGVHEHAHARAVDTEALRKKVAQFAEQRGMDYLILLDPDNQVGRRFNGGELPTNALIDREGRLRRRFVGGRSERVFAGMIEELRAAAQPR